MAAAACSSLSKGSAEGPVGLTSTAIVLAVGTNSCNSSSRFGSTAVFNVVTPVRLPQQTVYGLATSPSATGSLPVKKTIEIAAVAGFAANTAGPFATITAT